MAKRFFFDVETTGTDPKTNAIHQLSGAIEIDNEVIEYFDFKIKPFDGAIIEAKALEVSGVTAEQIMLYPDHATVYRQLIAILGKYVDKYNKTDKFFLAGYNNASFDNSFMWSFFALNNDPYMGSWFFSGSLDVMVIAANRLQEQRSSMPNFKLMTVARELGIEIDESKLHDATYDIYLTREIFNICSK